MGICRDQSELKIVVKCMIVACMEPLTVNELWKKVLNVMGGPHSVKLSIFGYETAYDFFKSIPDVVQLKNPEDINSLVGLVSSDLSRQMEKLVATNILRPPSNKKKVAHKKLMVPYRVQCAFIRIFMELYPNGLYICDFESIILSYPIFSLYIDHVESLLWNLDHIFCNKGSERIVLRSAIVNSVKNIKEEDKFTAEDILNIDEDMLDKKTNDLTLAYGLEYPLFSVLEEPIKNNIEILLDEYDWISERIICDLYNEKFGSSFAHYKRWGFNRVSQLFAKLPELCCVNFLDNDVEIISVKKQSIYVRDVNNLDEAIKKPDLHSVFLNKKSIDKQEKNDGALKTCLRADTFLEAPLNECFLGQKIQRIKLKINQSLNVKVCRVNTDIIQTIICQSLDKLDNLQTMLNDMKTFYFLNDAKFMFNPDLVKVNYIYAFCCNDLWSRGLVIHVNQSWVKMADIDNGLIHDIEIDDIRILHKRFSKLPAQSFVCFLHGIDNVDTHILSQIVDSKCVINIVFINQHDKSVDVKIQLADSKPDKYLNDEWIKNGVAEPV